MEYCTSYSPMVAIGTSQCQRWTPISMKEYSARCRITHHKPKHIKNSETARANESVHLKECSPVLVAIGTVHAFQEMRSIRVVKAQWCILKGGAEWPPWKQRRYRRCARSSSISHPTVCCARGGRQRISARSSLKFTVGSKCHCVWEVFKPPSRRWTAVHLRLKSQHWSNG